MAAVASDVGGQFPPPAGGGAPAVNLKEHFFSQMPLEKTWENTWVIRRQPDSALDQRNLTFSVEKQDGPTYMFLQDMRIRLTLDLRDKNGKVPPPNLTVAPVSNFLPAMMMSCRVFLNETQVSTSADGLYPLWPFVSNFTSYSSDRKKGIGELFGYIEDDTVKIDRCLPGTGFFKRRSLFGDTKYSAVAALETNYTDAKAKVEAAKKRLSEKTGSPTATSDEIAKITAEIDRLKKFANDLKVVKDMSILKQLSIPEFTYSSRKKDFYLELLTDFSGTSLPLLNGIGVRVEIRLAKPSAYLQCEKPDVAKCIDKGYYLHISSAELIIPARTMTTSLHLDIEKMLLKGSMEYDDLIRVDMRRLLIPQGTHQWETSQIKQSSTTPDRVIVMMCPTHIIESAYGHTPFFFPSEIKGPNRAAADSRSFEFMLDSDSASIEDMKMTLNTLPVETSESTRGRDSITRRKLVELFENLGRLSSEGAPLITPEIYKEHKFVSMYDLTKSKRAAFSGLVRMEPRQGTLTFSLSFNSALPCPVYLYVISEFHSKITCDKNRNIQYTSLT